MFRFHYDNVQALAEEHHIEFPTPFLFYFSQFFVVSMSSYIDLLLRILLSDYEDQMVHRILYPSPKIGLSRFEAQSIPFQIANRSILSPDLQPSVQVFDARVLLRLRCFPLRLPFPLTTGASSETSPYLTFLIRPHCQLPSFVWQKDYQKKKIVVNLGVRLICECCLEIMRQALV